jgi:heme oxygenase
MTDAAATPLSERLRDATRDDHREAETRAFVRDLLRGTLGLGDYVRLLRDLHELYSGLEEGLSALPAGVLPEVMLEPALRRRAALSADLDALHGRGWSEKLSATPAARSYRAELERIAASPAPHLLAAHAYVRYMGDLSGGRAIGRVVARAYDLAPGHGLAFYDFPGIPDVAAFKERFRSALDALGEGIDADRFVEEARRAFRRNGDVFEALERAR